MTTPTSDRREVLVTFRSERDAQTFLRDEIAEQYGATAALAAQDGERGGAEAAAAVEAVLQGEGIPGSNFQFIREYGEMIRAALADPAGALAKHDAEVWDEGHYAGWVNHIYASADEPKQKRNPYRADRIEGERGGS